MATYYIDYNAANDSANGTSTSTPWKRCPGMVGFAGSYSHSAGDVFVFKGGVTWPASCLSLSIGYSGSAGNIDTYTTDHTWYTGIEWSNPIFDGGGNKNKIITNNLAQSYFKVHEIKVINAGVNTSNNGYYGVGIAQCQHFELSYLVLATCSWIGIMVENYTGTTKTDIEIHHCDVIDAGMAIVVSNASVNSIITDVRIHHNKVHDLAPRLKYGVHGDGIHLWGSQTGASIQDISIHDNEFYGDWEYTAPSTGTTAFIYLEDKVVNALIYNNRGSYTNTSVPDGHVGRFIYCKGPGNGSGNIKIYNNSFRGTIPGQWAGIELTGNVNCKIKNNIIANTKKCYYISSSATSGLEIDYNDANYQQSYGKVGTYEGVERTWAQWQALGFDTHGIYSDPLFTNAPSDLTIQSSSPCVGIATVLADFTTDLADVTRGSIWDIGAYEYTPGGDVVLVVSNGVHAQTAGNITFTQTNHVLVVANSTHSQSVANLLLGRGDMPTTINNETFELLSAPQFGSFKIIRTSPKITFQAAAGYKHQRDRYPSPKYRFEHGWNGLETYECNLLRAWLDFAGSGAFYYVVPDSDLFTGIVNETHLVHIIEDEVEIIPLSNGVYRVKIVMEDL